MRPDPIHGRLQVPQSWNRFAYSLNDPTNLSDPLGLDASECFKLQPDGSLTPMPCSKQQFDGNGGMIVRPGEDNPYLTDWGANPLLFEGWELQPAGGGQIDIGGMVISGLTAIKKSICDTIPSGRVVGVSGGLGAVGAVVGGGELVVNYNSGQVSAFGFGGTQAGWNGVASGSVYAGYVWGLNNSNSNYSRGFSGVQGGARGFVGLIQASSGGLTADLGGAASLQPPVVVAGGLGTGAVGPFTAGVTVTEYSPPLSIGKFWPLALSPADALLFSAKQLCK
jgi:hypothetical protein